MRLNNFGTLYVCWRCSSLGSAAMLRHSLLEATICASRLAYVKKKGFSYPFPRRSSLKKTLFWGIDHVDFVRVMEVEDKFKLNGATTNFYIIGR